MSLTPLEVTAGAAVLTFVGAMLSLRQKALNDRKDAWWKRAQWAMDRTLSADPGERQLGYQALSILGRYRRATEEDRQVLRAAVRRALDDESE